MTSTHFECGASDEALQSLRENGFCVIIGYLSSSTILALSEAYDSAVANASGPNTHNGRSSTRVESLLDADPIFGPLYDGQILHAAAGQLIGGPYKLSCFHARSLHPHCEIGEFHIDFRSDEEPFPLLSFIYMIDEFSEENGATRFAPGSHVRRSGPEYADQEKCREQSVAADGPAGSVIIFDGRVWHAHGANSTSLPRRSVQASFIPAAQTSAIELDVPIFELEGRIRPSAK